ncbi:MAG: hypothetical protein DME55_13950 [Verrucomicrobia bacterium]|nr:MAG: hypothetical protein DME55_13950 [Verrucomicrobiota bacterium]
MIWRSRVNLAHFKAPHSVTFVKELPKTATGKIQKYIRERNALRSLRMSRSSSLAKSVGHLSFFSLCVSPSEMSNV